MRLARLVTPVLAVAVVMPFLQAYGVPSTAAPTAVSVSAPGAQYTADAAAPRRSTRSTITDTRRDVWRIVAEVDRKNQRSRVAGRTIGDVRTVRTRHTAGSLVIRTRLAELGRYKQALVVPAVQLRMPRGGLVTGFYLDAGADSGFYLYADGEIDCTGATRTIRPVRRAVELAIPRTCLGDPSWVRTRAITVYVRFEDRGNNRVRFLNYVDVAPGPRLKLRRALSTRAYAPAGAEVRDAAPVVIPEPVTPRKRAVRDLLDRLG